VETTSCAQCGAMIIAPIWAEHVSERRVRNVWSCDQCGYKFETHVYFASPSVAVDDDGPFDVAGFGEPKDAVKLEHSLLD
jgi:ribosomal protein S27AE